MSIEQEKMIVETLPSLYPLQKFEEDAIYTVLKALPHWIPVTERLPEKDGEYLTTWIDAQKKLCVNVFLVENGVWYWNQKYLFPNWRIIAWMPLPEPWKEVTK